MAKSIDELIRSLSPKRQEAIEWGANEIAKKMIANADSLEESKGNGDKQEARLRRKTTIE